MVGPTSIADHMADYHNCQHITHDVVPTENNSPLLRSSLHRNWANITNNLSPASTLHLSFPTIPPLITRRPSRFTTPKQGSGQDPTKQSMEC